MSILLEFWIEMSLILYERIILVRSYKGVDVTLLQEDCALVNRYQQA